MIVRMKKVSLLCLALRRDEALHALRDLGVLHVSALHPPAGQDLEKSRERLAQAGRALAVFDSVCVDAKSRLGVDSDGRGPTGEEIVAQVLQLAERREEAEASLKILEAELERLRPLGDFEPEVARRMADKGVFIPRRFGSPWRVPPKSSRRNPAMNRFPSPNTRRRNCAEWSLRDNKR
jgi:vacuolar-type H+-ATPase subunit I/STV1